jgi:hypothetical protein
VVGTALVRETRFVTLSPRALSSGEAGWLQGLWPRGLPLRGNFLEIVRMIYPDISLIDWMKKYPDLVVVKRNCSHCKEEQQATIPFIDFDVVGLVSADCPCGKNILRCMNMVFAGRKLNAPNWSRHYRRAFSKRVAQPISN